VQFDRSHAFQRGVERLDQRHFVFLDGLHVDFVGGGGELDLVTHLDVLLTLVQLRLEEPEGSPVDAQIQVQHQFLHEQRVVAQDYDLRLLFVDEQVKVFGFEVL